MNLKKLLGFPQFYSSIDEMPIYNWFKIQKTNDYSWCIKSGRKNWAKERDLHIHWDILFCEYIDTFGISDEFREILKLKAKIAIMKYDMHFKRNKGLKTLVDIQEGELNKKVNKEMNDSFNDVKTYLIKFLNGMPVDERIMTVKEYYGHIKVYQQEIKKQNDRKQ